MMNLTDQEKLCIIKDSIRKVYAQGEVCDAPLNIFFRVDPYYAMEIYYKGMVVLVDTRDLHILSTQFNLSTYQSFVTLVSREVIRINYELLYRKEEQERLKGDWLMFLKKAVLAFRWRYFKW